MIKFLPLLIFAFFVSPLAANQLSSQALSINVGPIEQFYSDKESTESMDTAGQISYGAPLYKQLLYSFSYYDEGDQSNCEGQESRHKRDGFSFQLWGALPVTKRLNVRFGIGPYLCFDTALLATQDFQQTRSVVPMYSLATSYDFKLFGHPSFAQLTINKTGTRDGFASTSYLLGLGAGPAHFSGETATAGIISASAGYNLSNEWELSFRINRVSTGSELETDNVLFGISRGL